MTVTCVDWRESDGPQIAALYAAEVRRWSHELGWDTGAVWKEVDHGRCLGTVLGRLAFDANGTCAGWTFGVVHRGTLQVGGLVAESEYTASALVESICQSTPAATATSISLFVWPDMPQLGRSLTERGLQVEEYDYLSAPCEPWRPVSAGPSASIADSPDVDSICGVAACGVAALRLWRPSDIDLTIEGLAAAYPGSDPSRPFAPGGTRGEWREYVTGLVGTASCGTLMRSSSFVAADASGRALGIVLVTRLAAATAHVAQLVVLPEAQKRGLGRLLLEAARRHARRGGCDRMTLLVARGNARAQRLYEESGFRTITTFLSARAVL